MTPTALFAAAFLSFQQSGAPAADEFATRQASGITLRYSIEMTPQDADALLATLQTSRDVIKAGFGVAPPPEIVVTLRKRQGTHRAWYTDGEDKVFLDFPNEAMVTRLQYSDERILRFTTPAFIQLWLFRSLSSTAGLDPRVLDSLTDYAAWLIKVEKSHSVKDAPPPEPPTGIAQCWYQLDNVYNKATTFVLNTLTTKKVPAHLLGKVLREIAESATDDPSSARLFDLITPEEPIFLEQESEPSAPIVASLALRKSRLSLFNGTPIIDAADEPIPASARDADFGNLFEMIARTLPVEDGTIRNEPPALRKIQLWPLYFEFRPRILKARDNLDYLLVVREFLSRFRDRALGLRPTEAAPVPIGSPDFTFPFGLGFSRIADRIYISRVTPDTEPAKAGLRPGLEIVSVDGKAPRRLLDSMISFERAFDSCPSEQRAEAMALDTLLCGAAESTCKLVVRDPAVATSPTDPHAGEKEFLLQRARPPTSPAVRLNVEKMPARPDRVAVIKIRSMTGDVLQRFVQAFDEAMKEGAKVILLDVRGNEGLLDSRSNERISLGILKRLLPVGSAPLVIGSLVSRDLSKFDAVRPPQKIVADASPTAPRFAGPVGLLIDAWTGGEAEWLALGMQLGKLGTVIGTTTGGTVSIPIDPPQPFQDYRLSRMQVSFSGNVVCRPDGGAIQSIGVAPQVVVTPTIDEITLGLDAAIERAAKQLLKE